MKIFYSPSNKGFYHEGIQKTIPTDAFEISEKIYKELSAGLAEGKRVALSETNTLYLEAYKIEENSPEQERAWRDSELSRSDKELYKIQDSDPKAVGLVADWRSYRKALRAWPENKNFPNKEFRPVAPSLDKE